MTRVTVFGAGAMGTVVGVELCSMMKNVAAIGLGMLDGLGKPTSEDYKNNDWQERMRSISPSTQPFTVCCSKARIPERYWRCSDE